MDEEIYRMHDISGILRDMNPHLELKESVKNIGEFTLDLFLTLDGLETRVQVPMDTFQRYGAEERRALEERLLDAYGILLRRLRKRDEEKSDPAAR